MFTGVSTSILSPNSYNQKRVRNYLTRKNLLSSLLAYYIYQRNSYDNSGTLKDGMGSNPLTLSNVTIDVLKGVFNGTSSKAVNAAGGTAGVLTTNFSLLIFFKGSSQAQFNALWSRRRAGQTNRGLLGANSTAGKLEFFHSATGSVPSVDTVLDSTWHCVMLRHTGTRITMHFDGKQDEDAGANTTSPFGTFLECMGCNSEGLDGFFNGDIAAAFMFSGDQLPIFYRLYRDLGRELRLRAGLTLLVGSSTMSGTGASDYAHSWAGLLTASELLNFRRVVNLAVSGTDTYQKQADAYQPAASPSRPAPINAQNISNVKSYVPDLVIFAPHNDVVNGYADDESMANYARVKAYCDTNQIGWFVEPPQPRNLVSGQRDRLYNQNLLIAAAYPNNYVDGWNGLAAADKTILPSKDSGDGTHPNDSGHGDTLYPRFKEKVESFYNAPELYTKNDEQRINFYTAEINSVNNSTAANFSVTSMSKVKDLVTYLKAQNIWKRISFLYVFLDEMQYGGGEVIVPAKGRFPLFNSINGKLPTIGATGATFDGATGMKTRTGVTLLTMPFSVMTIVKAPAQTTAYGAIWAQHKAATTGRAMGSSQSTAGNNDFEFFQNSGVGDLTTDNNHFDNNRRSNLIVHSGTRGSIYLNGSGTEVTGANTTQNIAQVDFSVAANFEGAGPNFFNGEISVILGAAEALNDVYAALHTNVASTLGLTIT